MGADEALGRIVEALPEGADVVVCSPIGMGPNTSCPDLLPDLMTAVLGDRNRDGGGSRSLWRLRAAVPTGARAAVAAALPGRVALRLTARLELRGTDWSRTRAFALPSDHHGLIRLNLRGRERYGVVDPGDADALCDEIAAGLMTFRDPDGSASIAAVERTADVVAPGRRSEQLPDLLVRWSDRPAVGLDRLVSPRFGAVVRQGAGSGRSGNHTDDAWALLVPGSARFREPSRSARVTDLAATAATLLGADASGLPGEPLLEAT